MKQYLSFPFLYVLLFSFLLITGCSSSEQAEQRLLDSLSDYLTEAGESNEENIGPIILTMLDAVSSVEIDTVVDSDGFGVLRYGIGYNPTTIRQSESELPDGFDDFVNCQQFARIFVPQLLAEATMIEERREPNNWCIISIPLTDLDGLREVYQSLFSSTTSDDALLDVRCLLFEEGEFFYHIDIRDGAILAEQAQLLKVFEIGVHWQISMPGEAYTQNSDSTTDLPLSWNLLDVPDNFLINLNGADACPSSRIKLLLEIDEGRAVQAQLTIPISRRAADIGRHNALRDLLNDQGWVTEVVGGSNSFPRIIAYRQVSVVALTKLLDSIPGVQGNAKIIPLSLGDSVTGPLAPNTISLNFSDFSTLWQQLLLGNSPTAFQLDIVTARPFAGTSPEWSDAQHLSYLWNGSADGWEVTLAFARQPATLGAVESDTRPVGRSLLKSAPTQELLDADILVP